MGASSGIGYAVAEALASRGVRVGLAARHTEPMHRLQQKYPEFVEYIDIDVTKPQAPDRLKLLIERTGGMDIYFHVAGARLIFTCNKEGSGKGASAKTSRNILSPRR